MKIAKETVLFVIGGGAYVLLELLYRGYSHVSMFLAGGLCLLLIGRLEEVEPKLPLPARVLTGAGIITMTELALGMVFNRDYAVWDYRDVPGNYMGQICLPFCLAWVPVSWAAGRFYLRLTRKLSGR